MLNSAIEKLNQLPFSSWLIKQTHKILLGVGGELKLRGELVVVNLYINTAAEPTHLLQAVSSVVFLRLQS